jgi:hypothetical protein
MAAPRKTTTKSSNGSKSDGASGPVQPFKYRSISEIQKKKVMEMRRENLEAEHFSISVQLDVLQEQPLPDEPNAEEQREEFIKQQHSQLAILESMIDSYSDRINDANEALLAETTEED